MFRRIFTKYTRLVITIMILLTMCMAGVFFYVLSQNRNSDIDRSLYFINKNDNSIKIYPFESDKEMYLFLPSGFDMHDFILVNNEKIIDDDLSEFDGNDVITIDTDRTYNLNVVRMNDVATLFMDVKIGSIDEVNKDKEKSTAARVNINIFDENSDMILNEKANIRGRGSASWLYHDKKSYNMNFYEDLSILGMNKSRKWALVTNPVDDVFNDDIFMDSNMVYEFARNLDFDYVVDCRYVNVYINGNYNGLYLLSERIDVETNRLDIDRDNTFLLDTDINLKIDQLDNYFITGGNNIIEIDYPESVSKSLLKTISEDVEKFEDALLDFDSNQWEKMIDMDSWARVYLIDELFENIDGGSHSVFFYKNTDGLYVRGPLWDYDKIFASREDAVVVGNEYRYSNQISMNYNYHLLQRESFRKRVAEIFKDEFIPLIRDRFPSIARKSETTRRSSLIADQIRWNEDKDRSVYAERLIEFMNKRSSFLEDYLNNEDKYCVVSIENPSLQFEYYTVIRGSRIHDIEGIDESLLKGQLYYKDSKEEFKSDDIIDEDIYLVRNLSYDSYRPDINSYEIQDSVGVINMLFMLLFGCAFVYLIYRFVKETESGKI